MREPLELDIVVLDSGAVGPEVKFIANVLKRG
jgi:hypothetical protein